MQTLQQKVPNLFSSILKIYVQSYFFPMKRNYISIYVENILFVPQKSYTETNSICFSNRY